MIKRCFWICLILFSFIPGTRSYSQGCNLLCNTDFENPNFGGWGTTHNSMFPCWYTTASDSVIEIWGGGFGGVNAYSGSQFIELNAYMVATMYQNFVVSPGTKLAIGFAHRGRNGIDSMSVSIGPAGGPYITLGTYGDNNIAWGYRTLNYTIPTGSRKSYSLRFNSVYATGQDQSIGNFLDDVSVSALTGQVSILSAPSACTGQTIHFSGSSPDTTAMSWDFGNGSTGTGTSSTSVYSSAGTYTVILIGKGTCGNDTVKQTITISSAPTVTAVASGPVCKGAKASLAASGATNYSWSPSTGLSSTSGSTVVFSGLSSSTYTVTGSNAPGCSNTALVNVTVRPAPFIKTSGMDTICQGTSTTLTASGATNYTWSPAGTLSSSSGASVVATPASGTQYTVMASDSFGCSSALNIFVDVLQKPLLTITGDTTVCKGNGVTLQASATTAGIYSWSGGVTGSTSGVTVVPVSGTNYTVSFAAGNCTATPQVIHVNVYQIPVPVMPPDTSLCKGQTVSLSVGGGPYAAYTWSGTASSTSSILTVTPDSTAYYIIRVQQHGCFSSPDTIHVFVRPAAHITVSGDSLICKGEKAHLIAAGGNNYIWSDSLHSTGPSIWVSPAAATDYSVFAAGRCNADSVHHLVLVDSVPGHAAFTWVNDPCNLDVQFLNKSTGGFQFAWDFGDHSFSSAIAPAHIYLHPGLYTVTLVINGGHSCADSLQEVLDYSASVASEIYIPNSFTPNGDGLNEKLELYGDGACFYKELEIYNRWGELVFQTNAPFSVFWDGSFKNQQAQVDLYCYKLIDAHNRFKTGIVTLLR
jgi:gliding motility-associated-like protein